MGRRNREIVECLHLLATEHAPIKNAVRLTIRTDPAPLPCRRIPVTYAKGTPGVEATISNFSSPQREPTGRTAAGRGFNDSKRLVKIVPPSGGKRQQAEGGIRQKYPPAEGMSTYAHPKDGDCEAKWQRHQAENQREGRAPTASVDARNTGEKQHGYRSQKSDSRIPPQPIRVCFSRFVHHAPSLKLSNALAMSGGAHLRNGRSQS